MANFELIRNLSKKTESKIVYLVIDGLGDLPHPDFGNKTPLEVAKIPYLNDLAKKSCCGLTIPVLRGITPGSGPAHLSLFGYDPIEYEVGRGILAALGIGIELRESDVAARINFCTVDEHGKITDRRAGRIPTEICAERCEELSTVTIEGAEVLLNPVKEYRASIILRGTKLGGNVNDTDPQAIGIKPKEARGEDEESQKTADLVNEFVKKATDILKKHDRANMILLRGFDRYRKFPSMQEIYNLSPACIATYPMYKGVTRLIGMEILETGQNIEDEFSTLKQHYTDHDFFYIHIKKTDSAGEDGDFKKKVEVLEELDSKLGILDELNPDVLVVCGDHSTPCTMKSHSWHPVPFLLHSKTERVDQALKFSENDCAKGAYGTFPATDAITMALAAAGKLDKYGA